MTEALRVFIVEDSESMSSAIEKHLIKEFGNNLLINQFDSVEKVLNDDQLKPDVMFLDHIMKNSKGVDSIRAILKKFNGLKIAIISEQNNIEVFNKAYSNGALEYIRKDGILFHKISDFINLYLKSDIS